MRIIKQVTRKVLARAGYELHRVSVSRVRFSEFASLAAAYEQRLRESGRPVPVEHGEMRTRLLADLQGTPPAEAYFIVEALARCADVPGDVCECGVAQGATSALIANEIRAGTKTLHLFDSFQGLTAPTGKDELKDDVFRLGSMEAYTGTMRCPQWMVRARLEAISFPRQRYVIHQGLIEDVLAQDADLPAAVSFAYVDMDLYQPTKLALDFLHERTPTGAILIVDDYDFFATGVKAAVDDFLAEMNSGMVRYECVVPDRRYGCCAVLTKR